METIEGGNEIMTNASRIINNEIRKQRREGKIEGIAEGKAEGKAEGIALIAKKLKGQMHIKDISQIFLNTVLFSFKLSGTFITLWLEDPLHSNVGLCNASTYCPSTKTSTYFKASLSFRSFSNV